MGQVVGKYPDRRRAQRRADWHNDVDRPNPFGDYDFWVSWHGPPLKYEVEPINPPDDDGCRWRVVGYPILEPVRG